MRLCGYGLLFLIAWALAPVGAHGAEPETGVRIAQGELLGRLRGDAIAYQGIPYAAAPVGAARWQPPGPAPTWAGRRDARRPGPACPQPALDPLDAGGELGPTSEDCLYLNVWTPREPAPAPRPVMVWIHGGALTTGAGHLAVYGGQGFVRRDVVLVTLNYRLGALGFFAHPALGEDAPLNFGLLDQIAALRWVQANIAAFGGDPGQVTIFGESAGAQSVLALFASPQARGLFHRGIAQSPYGIPSHTRARAREAGIRAAAALGLPGGQATAVQLRALPAEAFVGLKDRQASLAPSFIVGDAAVPTPLLTAFQRGRQAALPLVIGSNSDEASVAEAFGLDPAALLEHLRLARVVARALYPGVDDDALLGRYVVRDLVFTAFARRIAWLQSTRAPTWRYAFEFQTPAAARARAGVPHGGEIAYVFGSGAECDCLRQPFEADDLRVSGRMQARWAAFAHTGRPEPDGLPAWPRDGRRVAHTLVIGDQDLAEKDRDRRRLEVYIGLLKATGGILGPR